MAPSKERFPVIDLANPSLYKCLFVSWNSLFETFKQTKPLFKSQMAWSSIQWKAQFLRDMLPLRVRENWLEDQFQVVSPPAESITDKVAV
jgi:hypothetical protein